MAPGLVADPSLVDRISGALIARIDRNAESLRAIIERGVHGIGREDQYIARVELRRQPAQREFLTHAPRVAAVIAAAKEPPMPETHPPPVADLVDIHASIAATETLDAMVALKHQKRSVLECDRRQWNP